MKIDAGMRKMLTRDGWNGKVLTAATDRACSRRRRASYRTLFIYLCEAQSAIREQSRGFYNQLFDLGVSQLFVQCLRSHNNLNFVRQSRNDALGMIYQIQNYVTFAKEAGEGDFKTWTAITAIKITIPTTTSLLSIHVKYKIMIPRKGGGCQLSQK
jgi:hypothetical protein